ncbi:MAG: hypothetical protein Q9187_005759 [Circinaria calcarea]
MDQSHQSLNSLEADQTVMSESAIESVQSDSAGPDYRSHVGRGKGAMVLNVYETGQQVYVKGARALSGPYIIRKVNRDGTYQLGDAGGRIYRDNARERDLQPL